MDGHASIETWKYEDLPDGRYTLAYGNGPGNWVWGAGPQKSESEVLADRWFESKEPYKSAWLGDRVYYSQYDEDRPMYLPSTWL